MDKTEKLYKNMLEKLREICNQKNITYYFLAKSTGLSPSSISCLMRGKSKPYLYTILMICDAMNISVQDLIQDEDTTNKEPEEKCLIQIFRQLPPEKRRLLKIYVNMLQEYTGDV